MDKDENHLNILLDILEEAKKEDKTNHGKTHEQISNDQATRVIQNIPKYREISSEDFLKPKPQPTCSKSLVHSGDTDSSDDEDNIYGLSYTSFGKSVKTILNTQNKLKAENFAMGTFSQASTTDTKNVRVSNLLDQNKKGSNNQNDLYAEPISGIRVINPLVCFQTLRERMQGRQSIAISDLKQKNLNGNLVADDWFTIGVLVSSSPVKTSQKGSKYIIWKLSDLKGDLKTISLFLFSSAYSVFSQTATGCVVGILNPSVMEKRNNNEEASLSIDVPQKLLIIGKSKDFGYCKSKKKDGSPCNAFVNTYTCPHCIYHAQQEYKKSSKRSELQSSGCNSHLALRNKILGKHEVFYGGQSYVAIPAKKSKKLEVKDRLRLEQLSGMKSKTPLVDNLAVVGHNSGTGVISVQIPSTRFKQQMALLSSRNNEHSKARTSLQLGSSKQTSAGIKCDLVDKLSILQEGKQGESKPSRRNAPSLPMSANKNCQSFPNAEEKILSIKNKPNIQKFHGQANAATQQYRNGTSNATDDLKLPKNATYKQYRLWLKAKQERSECVLKSVVPTKKMKLDLNEEINVDAEAGKKLSDQFKDILTATSRHTNLVDIAKQEAQEDYFQKMETKEKIEEKLLSTFKVNCKAVQCLQCKYTAFSSSDFCKTRNHTIRVIDAVKRFFECRGCSNRTVTLDIIPTTSCKQCGASQWMRAAMIKEKKAQLNQLSICGNDEKNFKFCSDANLNLLVPE